MVLPGGCVWSSWWGSRRLSLRPSSGRPSFASFAHLLRGCSAALSLPPRWRADSFGVPARARHAVPSPAGGKVTITTAGRTASQPVSSSMGPRRRSARHAARCSGSVGLGSGVEALARNRSSQEQSPKRIRARLLCRLFGPSGPSATSLHKAALGTWGLDAAADHSRQTEVPGRSTESRQVPVVGKHTQPIQGRRREGW